jgi:uridine kinase
MYTFKIPSCDDSFRSDPPLHSASVGNDRLSARDDAQMTHTYEILARNALQALRERENNSSTDNKNCCLWIAVCGGPGSGKSTLAAAVASQIYEQSHHTITAACLPMDGYHYSQAQLRHLGYSLNRRGAPWTFDAEQMAKDLQDAKEQLQNYHGRQEASSWSTSYDSSSTNTILRWFPAYSRAISDPVADQVPLYANARIILVEGNYLMLGTLAENDRRRERTNVDDDDGIKSEPRKCNNTTIKDGLSDVANTYDGPRSLQDELLRWKPVTDNIFDYCWYVDPCQGYDEQRRRLIQRALVTWNDEKTVLWGGGTALEAASRRVETNDHKNAILVECCKPYADVVVASL